MFFFISTLIVFFVMVQDQIIAIKSFESHDRLIGPLIYSRLRRELTTNFDSTKDSYDRAINESITDYYAQRKAVMDKYYARQREILEKFSKNVKTLTSTQSSMIDSPLNDNINNTLMNDDEDSSLDISTTTVKQSKISHHTKHESGYERQGECQYGPDEQLVYQHNLGIGLKGPSQLDATLKVNLDGPISITCVEALPFNNSNGILSWLGGGPGTDFFELNLRALKNKGVSYTIKVWGIKLTQ